VSAIAPYLRELGVSHVYLSPLLQARTGSTHGYDVVDHRAFNAELGGVAGYERMCAALEAEGLGQIVDIVPNHTAVGGRENALWWDVLKHGRGSRYASFFDIDWDAPPDELRGKVLVPILGGPLEDVLARNEIRLDETGRKPLLRYFEHELPVAPGSLGSTERRDVATLLAGQNYLLADWHRAASELNYRRFFDINDLAALRVDEPGVFEATHELVLSLVAAGHLQGLRVDHIDGLSDPRGYLERLRLSAEDAYVVVEKILEPGEAVPEGWPVEGTTGYDFLNVALAALVDPDAEESFTSTYRDLTGETTDLAELTRSKKLLVMRSIMDADIARLVRCFLQVVEDLGGEKAPYPAARLALEETIASLPVYRTYVAPGGTASGADRTVIEDALRLARQRTGPEQDVVLDRLEGLFLGTTRGAAGAFVARFQQTTGPVMAKGVEDTLFYNYNRFVALNEVGGDPGRFGRDPGDIHREGLEAASRRPSSMVTLATHDTKRGEDMRARLAVLTEVPDAWAAAVRRWSGMAERHRSGDLPDRNVEYLWWQTLVGAWPLDEDRALEYISKAAREAKRYTSWLAPDTGYEKGLEGFIKGVLGDRAIAADVSDFTRPLIDPGRINSLAQTLLKLTWPGVPDTYQGTEVWDLSLVDPDNRRPVDFELRRKLLAEVSGMTPEDAWARRAEGVPKLYLAHRALGLRATRPEAFAATSPYEPLEVEGPGAPGVLGFCRGEEVAAILPRLPVRYGSAREGTFVRLPPGRWRDELAGVDIEGGAVPVGDLLSRFPVALLTRSQR
jgi:(1->4)-alpha-D-glucan 1-alpha-D-glucosylmutase